MPAQEREEMRAAVVTGAGRMSLRRAPAPQPGPGEVLVRLEGCGVCASNLVPWSGPDWMRFPTEPGALGHEGWGVVAALGPGVSALRPGQRVAVLGQRSYAEYDVAPAEAVVALPTALDGRAFPGEAFACAMNIFRRARIGAGETVAIVGIGFLGAVLTRLAAAAGAQVIAIARRPFARALARRLGAAHVLEMDDHARIIARVGELTDGRLCACVIEAVGKAWPLDLAGELTGEGGRLVVAGYHQDGPRQVDMRLWNWRGIDVINAHERRMDVYVAGLKAAIAAVESGLLDPADFLTHSFPLARLDAALNATRDRPDGFLKAVVVP